MFGETREAGIQSGSKSDKVFVGWGVHFQVVLSHGDFNAWRKIQLIKEYPATCKV